jgi:hypothetical protein
VKLFCPSCGNAIEFRYDDSFVRVCDACHSAVLRSDRGIESLGRFSDLAAAASGLELRDRGQWQGQSFDLAGRAEYRHSRGGSWEEWYLRFDDGRWGWLSYAEGRWALTFPSALDSEPPAFEALPPGARLQLRGLEFQVLERNQAQLASASGEIPFSFSPGETARFVDLGDGQGRFATLDYAAPGASEVPQLFVGRSVDFAQLGLRARAPAEPAATGAGERLACPQCGGSVELRLPGSSKSVVCPYCAAVLECEGPLAILSLQAQGEARRPPIPLGARATFAGTEYTVTGRLRRAVSVDGTEFEWDEYLLHAPQVGYRWLVCSQGHYSFVREIAPGAVVERTDSFLPQEHFALCNERSFRLFERAEAKVSEAYGEFYWRVSAGESVQTRDYVKPPWMLSRELSDGELHWSLGVYQSVAQVRAAFHLPELPDLTQGVAPHQPFPHRHWFSVAAALALALLIVAFALAAREDGRGAYSKQLQLGSSEMPAAAESNAAGQTSYVYFTPSFELRAGQNVEISVHMPLANSWAYAVVDLVHEESGELASFDAELSHYSGVEDGEAWSEGSPAASHISRVQRSGKHVLRLEVQTPGASRSQVSLSVNQGVFDWGPFLLALVLIGLPAALLAIYGSAFESQRWANSDLAPAPAGGDDDDSDDSDDDD